MPLSPGLPPICSSRPEHSVNLVPRRLSYHGVDSVAC